MVLKKQVLCVEVAPLPWFSKKMHFTTLETLNTSLIQSSTKFCGWKIEFNYNMITAGARSSISAKSKTE